MAIAHLARDLNSGYQYEPRLLNPSVLGERLAFLKVSRHVFGVLLDHRLKLRQASFEISLRNPGLGQRVLQKYVVWIGLKQLFDLLSCWQVLRPGKAFTDEATDLVLRRSARRASGSALCRPILAVLAVAKNWWRRAAHLAETARRESGSELKHNRRKKPRIDGDGGRPPSDSAQP
jgi:hypothetical protein